ncbi:MAG: hypothetical protein GY849_09350 [Deltaproteobacteria bacterium]|nr:hypothetical protein [Deltaproteobacteria bacterium]
MKAQKSWSVIGPVVLVAALIAGSGFLSSCGPRGFCERGFHPPFHGKDFSKRILERMDKKVENLGLTEMQHKKYGEIRRKIEADFKKMSEGRKALFKDIQGEINKENPDMNRVAGLLKGRFREMPDRMERHLDHFVEFYGMLNEDQKSRLLEKVRDRIGKCES